jgi:hypothetical protein
MSLLVGRGKSGEFRRVDAFHATDRASLRDASSAAPVEVDRMRQSIRFPGGNGRIVTINVGYFSESNAHVRSPIFRRSLPEQKSLMTCHATEGNRSFYVAVSC